MTSVVQDMSQVLLCRYRDRIMVAHDDGDCHPAGRKFLPDDDDPFQLETDHLVRKRGTNLYKAETRFES